VVVMVHFPASTGDRTPMVASTEMSGLRCRMEKPMPCSAFDGYSPGWCRV